MSNDKWIVCVSFMNEFLVISHDNRWTGDMMNAKEFDSVEKAREFREAVGVGSFIDLHPRCRYE